MIRAARRGGRRRVRQSMRRRRSRRRIGGRRRRGATLQRQTIVIAFVRLGLEASVCAQLIRVVLKEKLIAQTSMMMMLLVLVMLGDIVVSGGCMLTIDAQVRLVQVGVVQHVLRRLIVHVLTVGVEVLHLRMKSRGRVLVMVMGRRHVLLLLLLLLLLHATGEMSVGEMLGLLLG